MYCAGLKHCPHLLQQFIYIRGSRIRYNTVDSVTTVNSWNSPDETQDWSHAEMTLLGLGLVKYVTMSHVKKSSEEPQWRKAYSGLGIVNHLTKS